MLLGLLLLLLLLSLYQVKFNFNGFNRDYLSKDYTDSIKGIFILLIVISHAQQYIRPDGYAYDRAGDSLFLFCYHLLDQLVVVMFLFYSGYGVGEAFKNRGSSYVQAMPRHRILGTLVNFDIAVLVYIALCLLLGLPITFRQSVLSLAGWENVGNDNWYIFVILLCYFMTYVVLRLPIRKRFQRCAILFALCAVCLFVLSFYKKYYWSNTILCYPLGFLYSTYKDSIEAHVKRSYWIYAAALLVIFVPVYVLFHNCRAARFQLGYNLVSMLFALVLVMVTMKVRIYNKPLRWAGIHLFPIYIYMRVPMIIMWDRMPDLLVTHFALYVVICMIVSLIIAHFYKYWEVKL